MNDIIIKLLMKPQFYNGKIFDSKTKRKISSKDDFLNELKESQNDKEPYLIIRCNIFDNPKSPSDKPNKKIIFEIDFGKLEDEIASFQGFIYPDNTIAGKITYQHFFGSKIAPQIFNGTFITVDQKILIHGGWQSEDASVTLWYLFEINTEI